MNKYEIEPVYYPDYFMETEIAMLTGLELPEILTVTKDIKRWSGSTYIRIFQSLGYSCNPRFIKFDKETKYPCMMRTRKLKVKNFWYGFVYYDHKIYLARDKEVLSWEEWNEYYPNFRITSMLQVWI